MIRKIINRTKMDEIIKAISNDGFISVSVVDSLKITKDAQEVHGTSPIATDALGRTLAAASIIGTTLKKQDSTVTVAINGGGPAGNIVAVSDESGFVRGFIQNPRFISSVAEPGKPDIRDFVGRQGMLSVTRDYREKEPYTGATRLVSGDISGDISSYFKESEQIPTKAVFGTLFDEHGSITASGGFISQLLPGVHDEKTGDLFSNIDTSGIIAELLKTGGAQAVLDYIFRESSYRIMARMTVGYRCTCSRESFLSAVLSLDRNEIDDMRRKAEPIEAICQFCRAVYTFMPEELGELSNLS